MGNINDIPENLSEFQKAIIYTKATCLAYVETKKKGFCDIQKNIHGKIVVNAIRKEFKDITILETDNSYLLFN